MAFFLNYSEQIFVLTTDIDSCIGMCASWPDVPNNNNWFFAQDNFINNEIACDNKTSLVGLAGNFGAQVGKFTKFYDRINAIPLVKQQFQADLNLQRKSQLEMFAPVP
ncbi:MAG: hypothetical protein ACK5WZ_13950 [Pseudobdellovibrionaceae bacterium]